MLVGWDYSSEASSPAAAYFNVVFHNILKLTFRDEMPEELWPAGGDRWYAVVSSLLKSPRSRWWDDVATQDRVETRDDILLAALTQGRKEITSLISATPTSGNGASSIAPPCVTRRWRERQRRGRATLQPGKLRGRRRTRRSERHGLRRP